MPNRLPATQRTVPGPGPLADLAMSYDPGRGRTVLFGGRQDNTSASLSNQTWEWDGIAWTQQAISGPSARLARIIHAVDGRVAA